MHDLDDRHCLLLVQYDCQNGGYRCFHLTLPQHLQKRRRSKPPRIQKSFLIPVCRGRSESDLCRHDCHACSQTMRALPCLFHESTGPGDWRSCDASRSQLRGLCTSHAPYPQDNSPFLRFSFPARLSPESRPQGRLFIPINF